MKDELSKVDVDVEKLEKDFNSFTSSILSSPIVVGIFSAGGTALAFAIHWRYTRRIKNAEYLTPAVIKWRKMLVGKVTR